MPPTIAAIDEVHAGVPSQRPTAGRRLTRTPSPSARKPEQKNTPDNIPRRGRDHTQDQLSVRAGSRARLRDLRAEVDQGQPIAVVPVSPSGTPPEGHSLLDHDPPDVQLSSADAGSAASRASATSSTNGSSDGIVCRRRTAGRRPAPRRAGTAAPGPAPPVGVPVVAPVAAAQGSTTLRPGRARSRWSATACHSSGYSDGWSCRGTPRPGPAAAGSAPRPAARPPTTSPLAPAAPGRGPVDGSGDARRSARIAGARNRCESRSSAAAGTTSPTASAGGPRRGARAAPRARNEIPASTSSRGRGRRSRPSRRHRRQRRS